MVFAKTSKAAARLSEQVKKHIFLKKYMAIVEGEINSVDYLKLETKILKNELERKSYVSSNGQEAKLEFKTLNTYIINNQIVSLLDIKLLTGRFHQIRCQFSSIGHPLYGDTKYGSKNKIDQDDFPLYAYSLTFIHPTLKKEMTFNKIEDNKFIKTLY
jgi:23S rRNA pseudouridine1911/1915/1917 synthase